jgi:hypothetical protein
MADNDGSKRRMPPAALAGAAVAVGAGIGTALMAGSGNAAWIGIGAGFGVLFVLIGQRKG